jgi:hypothetical protein
MIEMPPILHIAANPVTSDTPVELVPMSDTSKLWSLPWHALQRSLAQSRCDPSNAEAMF